MLIHSIKNYQNMYNFVDTYKLESCIIILYNIQIYFIHRYQLRTLQVEYNFRFYRKIKTIFPF